ncbi:YkvA family protein [Peribacillus deserti]|uniref:Methyltransferase type 11 n=1 Tax=Peribacillus deserti TaxID=673318 RepID=A0A2N5M3V6_9BACI|nr:YkvA family protein [Peribacillus deserti]PLT28963.1 methyltransferase type 11 [Peribacillus deserti]
MLRRWLFTTIASRLFSTAAERYIHNKKSSKGLISKAAKKAVKNENSLKGIWPRLQLLFEMIKAWAGGRYRNIPYRSLLMILIAVIYFVSPLDFVPDFLLGFGILDDAAVLGFILSQVDHDIHTFQDWKMADK